MEKDILQPPVGPQVVEFVYVDENPLYKVARQRGHFGPFPMKNTWDRLYYGTGLAYLGGITCGASYGVWRGTLFFFNLRIGNCKGTKLDCKT
jgi:hypothetical protein